MGLLKPSECISWDEIQIIKEMVKSNGIDQFIYVWKRFSDFSPFSNVNSDARITNLENDNNRKQDSSDDNLKYISKKDPYLIWGDELEFMMCIFTKKGSSRLILGSDVLIEQFQDFQKTNIEYARYMVETTPEKPYGGTIHDFLFIENNMLSRILRIQIVCYSLFKSSSLLLIPSFPKLGFYKTFLDKNDEISDYSNFNQLHLVLKLLFYAFIEYEQQKSVVRRGESNHNSQSIENLKKYEENILSQSTSTINFTPREISKNFHGNTNMKNEKMSDVLKFFTETELLDSKIAEFEDFINILLDKTNDEIECYINKIINQGNNLSYDITQSLFFPDNAISLHSRFESFTKNVRRRRGRQIEGYIQTHECETTQFSRKNPMTIETFEKSSHINSIGEDPKDIVYQNKTGQRHDMYKSKPLQCKTNHCSVPNGMKERGFTRNCNNLENKTTFLNPDTNQIINSRDIQSDSFENNFKKKITSKHLLNNISDSNKETISKKEGNVVNDDEILSTVHSNDRSPLKISEICNLLQNQAKNDPIKIDSVGQGMGSCCLQVTIQGRNLDETRHLYDKLGILGPLFLRLTRGSPIIQGKLLKTETRWDVLSFSVDCRTSSERGNICEMSGEENEHSKEACSIPKSRYSSMDLYISEREECRNEYNDINTPIHTMLYEKMLSNGIDSKMSKHVASLFIRDPLMVYRTFETEKMIESVYVNEIGSESHNLENTTSSKSPLQIQCTKNNRNNTNLNDISYSNKILVEISDEIKSEQNNEAETNYIHNGTNFNELIDTDDFENIQSSNWRSVRLKLPSQDSIDIERGWKVEFRTMEIQPTAFENCAWSIFTLLLVKSIIYFDLNLYIPISMVDKNFEIANICSNTHHDYFIKTLIKSEKNSSKNLESDYFSFMKPSNYSSVALNKENIKNDLNLTGNDSTPNYKSLLTDAIETSSMFLKEKNKKKVIQFANSCSKSDLKSLKVPKDHSKFFYRKNLFDKGPPLIGIDTLEIIFLGDGDQYSGLFNIVQNYLDEISNDITKEGLEHYFRFIKGRLTGMYMSVADFMRSFVANHHSYRFIQHGSSVPENVLDDLIKKITSVTTENDVSYLENVIS